jgi:hypothetical protein
MAASLQSELFTALEIILSLWVRNTLRAGEVPVPQVYQELLEELEDSNITAHAGLWQLAIRPDIQHIVTNSGTVYTVFIVAPNCCGKSRCIAWQHACGACAVLPEVTDAAAAIWSPVHQSWQLLSPVFGVLLVHESDGLDATLPVAPLLEAAISRQLAGVASGYSHVPSRMAHTGMKKGAECSINVSQMLFN